MNKFILVDVSHTANRAKYTVRGDAEEKVGMILHIIMNSIGKCARLLPNAHLVFCFDGKSWRKEIYAPYKRNRQDVYDQKTSEQKDVDAMMYQAIGDLKEYFSTKTNCTVLHDPKLEADDCIAAWIQAHPDDEHIIVSGDGDFAQLLTDKVSRYDGVTDMVIKLDGVYDFKGTPVIDKKTKLQKTTPNPKWSIFEKAVRGCSTDNVFSAYPGARVKGSKNKVGMMEAFEDRDKMGFSWNNFMLQKWNDHEGVEHRVLDDYERNVTLVDLSKQPSNIRKLMDSMVVEAKIPKSKSMIGAQFMKFCGKHQLIKLSENATKFADMFSRGYTEK